MTSNNKTWIKKRVKKVAKVYKKICCSKIVFYLSLGKVEFYDSEGYFIAVHKRRW